MSADVVQPVVSSVQHTDWSDKRQPLADCKPQFEILQKPSFKKQVIMKEEQVNRGVGGESGILDWGEREIK